LALQHNALQKAREELNGTIFESRINSAFFSKKIMTIFDTNNVKFTASVPFERFLELKDKIEKYKRWRVIDREWSYFETNWKPKSQRRARQIVEAYPSLSVVEDVFKNMKNTDFLRWQPAHHWTERNCQQSAMSP